MYLPYLRGRQYELIALRELVDGNKLSKKIIPIIELVKLSSTLIKTINRFIENEMSLCLIMNPEVGSFYDDYNNIKNEKLLKQFNDIIESKTDKLMFAEILNGSTLQNSLITEDKIDIVICTNRDYISNYNERFSKSKIKYFLIPDDSGFRRRIRDNRVMLNDNFNKLDRNTDYSQIVDEYFSEDHLFYLGDGYIGFSDYSIVGYKYSDSGFAPRAVVIHIVYFNSDNSLRIKHFVSDSNDDIQDPAGKFGEALAKLVECNDIMFETLAMKEFKDLYNRFAYPGLGTIKKLSIMHHLELVGNYLDEGV